MSKTSAEKVHPFYDPVGPSADEWTRMSEAEREHLVNALLDELAAAEEDALDPLSAGDPHYEAVEEMRSALRTYFGKQGRRIYIAAEIAVIYPGKKAFKPDIIAVTDVDPAPRNSWIVAQEGKGIDLAIEIHNQGDFRKDFVLNVEQYGQLGIQEYFAYAIGRQRLNGFRLRGPGARQYRPILPQAGRYTSEVLGLDLALHDAHVRLYAGNAQLLPDSEMRVRLEAMVNAAQARAEQEQARAEQASQRLAESLLLVLRVRGLVISPELGAHILGCQDLPQMERWLARAGTISAPEELLQNE